MDYASGVTGEINVPDPMTGHVNEGIPCAGKRELEDDADDTVVVILDHTGETFATFENQRFYGFDDGWPLVSDIARGGMFERRLGESGCSENFTKAIKPNFFADIELKEHD